MCAAVFHQWFHEYCPLKHQLSLACQRNTYLWRHPTNNSKMVSNRSSDISSATDNAIFKNSALNNECNCCQIILFHFCGRKFVQHGPITIAIDCNGLLLLIFKDKWSNYGSGTKFAPNSDSFWVHRLFSICVRVFCAPNAIILLVYIPAKIKMSFIWKDDFFCQNRRLL